MGWEPPRRPGEKVRSRERLFQRPKFLVDIRRWDSDPEPAEDLAPAEPVPAPTEAEPDQVPEQVEDLAPAEPVLGDVQDLPEDPEPIPEEVQDLPEDSDPIPESIPDPEPEEDDDLVRYVCDVCRIFRCTSEGPDHPDDIPTFCSRGVAATPIWRLEVGE